MSNLKKPYFWGFMLVELYWISFAFAGMVTMPSSLVRIIYGIVGFSLCYVVVNLFRRPVSNSFYIGITLMIVGVVFIAGGIGLLNNLLNPLHPINYYEYSQWFEVLPVLAAVMTLCGALTVLFSIIGLISNTKSRKLVVDLTSHTH